MIKETRVAGTMKRTIKTKIKKIIVTQLVIG